MPGCGGYTPNGGIIRPVGGGGGGPTPTGTGACPEMRGLTPNVAGGTDE